MAEMAGNGRKQQEMAENRRQNGIAGDWKWLSKAAILELYFWPDILFQMDFKVMAGTDGYLYFYLFIIRGWNDVNGTSFQTCRRLPGPGVDQIVFVVPSKPDIDWV